MPEFATRFERRKTIEFMSTEDRKKIHESALDVMERTGVRIHSAVARGSLKKAGAVVDEKTHDVKFPKGLVGSLMRTIPKKMVLAGRTEEFDLPMDGTHSYYTTDGCGISVWEQKTQSRRLSTLEDIRRTAVISDWLPYVSIYEPMVVAHDVAKGSHVLHGMRVSMENTSKHILTESTTNPKEARAQVKMASEIVGSEEELRKRHYISAMVCTISPLTLDGAATDAAMVWAENHVPVHITGMSQTGISGPATLAGTLVVNHAETLGLACAMQAHSAGAPLLYGSVLSSMDPKTGSYMGGSPESTILCAGAVEMAYFCGIPNSTGGFGSGAKVPGTQASLENSIMAMTSAMVGGEVVNGLGVPDGSTLLSYEQLIIDNEIAAMVGKMFGKLEVSDDTIALDLINKIGIGGSYLTQMHTMKHMREFYMPMLWDSEPFDSWVKKGRKDVLEVAGEKASQILKDHKPARLDDGTSEKLADIVKSFEKA
jgi:trimethylamine--corrinoid protein Co-methyltransferase